MNILIRSKKTGEILHRFIKVNSYNAGYKDENNQSWLTCFFEKGTSSSLCTEDDIIIENFIWKQKENYEKYLK